MKIGTTANLKFKRLKRRLGIPEYQVVGILETLWQVTTDSADEGQIGKFSDEDIALALEWDGDATGLVDALVETRWLDRDDVHRLVVHDWLDHAPEFVKERVRKRAMRANKKPNHAPPSPNLSQHSPDKAGQTRDTTGHVRDSPNISGPVPSLPSHATSIQAQPHHHQPGSKPPSVVETSEPTPANWGVVAVELKEIGVKRTQATVDAAKSNGFNPPQVLALIAWLKQQPAGAYQPGVLVERLGSIDAVGWDAHENWPTPAGTTVASEPDRYAKPTKTPQQIADDEREARRKREKFREDERLNAPFVEVLDGMSEDDLEKLVSGPGNGIARSQLKAKGRDSPDARPLLLKLLRERDAMAM